MAARNYIVYFSNSSTGGTPITGLTPTWTYLNKLTDNTAFIPQPAITELDHGCYQFSFDVDTNGEVRGQIDGGAGISITGDRFIVNTINYSDAQMPVNESYATLHSVPTLGQLLFEIRALLAESQVAGITLTTKRLDGSTTAHTYTLNDAASPTRITTGS